MSLRARLVAATSLVALVALAIAALATYTAFSTSQLKQVDEGLQRTHEPVEKIIASGATGIDLEHQIEVVAPGTYIELQQEDGTKLLSIPSREVGHDELYANLGVLDDYKLPVSTQPGDADPSRFVTLPATEGSTELRVRVSRLDTGSYLAVGQSLHDVTESRRRLLEIEALVAAVALFVAGLVGWVLVRVGLRPLHRVEQTALAIADGGDLDQLVPGADRPTEVGRLASALNTMLGRIRTAFAERDTTEAALRTSEERMRRFVADVSHELRTPLAAVSAYSELFDRGARDHPADLERAMRGINLETARMHELVEELLLLARLDEGRPLERKAVDLSEVVVQAISAARTVAPDWPISLKVAEVVMVVGDAGKLRQVFDNLLANVRTHTASGTATAIDIRTRANSAVVTVRDNGPGMEPDQAARVFERFFRADASRSRRSGGAGLGMAIVHGIITAHGGRVRLDTRPGQGVVVEITLPRDQAADIIPTD